MGDCARLRLGSPQSPTPPARPQLQTGYRPQSVCSPPGSPSPTNSPPDCLLHSSASERGAKIGVTGWFRRG